MTINLNIEAAKKELANRQAAQLPPDRDRALQELSSVLDANLSVELFIGICHALAEKPWVRSSLADIRVGEVLRVSAPAKKKAKRAGAGGGTKRSDATQAAMTAITTLLSTDPKPLSKGQIFDAVLKGNAGIGEKVLKTAWVALRDTALKGQGKGPMTKYTLVKP